MKNAYLEVETKGAKVMAKACWLVSSVLSSVSVFLLCSLFSFLCFSCFFFSDVLPLFFSSSVRNSLLSQFNSSWSPSVLSYFLPCVCLLLVVSSSVFPLSRCLFFLSSVIPLWFPLSPLVRFLLWLL